MLQGIKIRPIQRFPDERGFFSEVMRTDWKDLFGEDTTPKQTTRPLSWRYSRGIDITRDKTTIS
jgi:dTDP-4-dehydrorhamnose 3,5-epimerase-like enzyme